MARAPNPRLQRTRSAPLRSPLSRQPLGPAHHKLPSRLTVLLVGALSVGCVERFALRYDCAGVEPYRSSYRVRRGELQVLQLYRVRGVPIPDAFSGYSLYLAVQPELVREGSAISIPGAGVSAYLWTLSAPSYRRSALVTGQIRVKRVRNTELVAELEVQATDLAWTYRGLVAFKSAVVVPGLTE